jgi:hypothetical protein
MSVNRPLAPPPINPKKGAKKPLRKSMLGCTLRSVAYLQLPDRFSCGTGKKLGNLR